MELDIRGTVKYPMIHNDRPLVMSFRGFESTSAHSSRMTMRPGVRAATLLHRDSSTEVIDIHGLAQKSSSVIQYVSNFNDFYYNIYE